MQVGRFAFVGNTILNYAFRIMPIDSYIDIIYYFISHKPDAYKVLGEKTMTSSSASESQNSPLSDHPQKDFQSIADEIIKMSEADQKMRKSGQWDSSVDVENTRRMKEIVAQIGWPTISKVGSHASDMAWLLVQHADHDREFQKMCLDLLKAQPEDEVCPANIAYLENRVRVGAGRPQLYGTQFHTDEAGKFGPWPIEDPDNVDERRKAVGLQPLSEYTRRIEESYKQLRANSPAPES